jgi:HEAT repeat protein
MPLIRKPQPPAEPASPAPLANPAGLSDLSSSNDDVRWAAARSAPGQDGAVQALGAALHSESNPRVREAIFTALARIGTSQSVDLILPLLRSDQAELRSKALDALHLMKDALRHYVPGLLADQDPDVRILACELSRNLPDSETSKQLCHLLLTETEVNVCASAVEVLAETGDRDAVAVLSTCRARFHATPFLDFSIKLAIDRILQSTEPRG